MNTNTNKETEPKKTSVAEHYAAREYAAAQPYYADHYIEEDREDLPQLTSPISIDEAARDTLDRYFYDNPLSPIRIYITTRSQKGPKLALRPDAQTDKDLAFEVEEYTFLISPHLAHQLGHIHIAAYDMGFQVIPEHPLHQPTPQPSR